MKHLRAINRKASRMQHAPAAEDIFALQDSPEQAPYSHGLRFHFSPGWEVICRRHSGALSAGRTRHLRLLRHLLLAGAGTRPSEQLAGLDQQVCWATKDWRNVDIVFP